MIRVSNSTCSSMARPFYLVTPLQAVARLWRCAGEPVVIRHSGALDSGKEGEAP